MILMVPSVTKWTLIKKKKKKKKILCKSFIELSRDPLNECSHTWVPGKG
jgi:hypothetical protein